MAFLDIASSEADQRTKNNHLENRRKSGSKDRRTYGRTRPLIEICTEEKGELHKFRFNTILRLSIMYNHQLLVSITVSITVRENRVRVEKKKITILS